MKKKLEANHLENENEIAVFCSTSKPIRCGFSRSIRIDYNCVTFDFHFHSLCVACFFCSILAFPSLISLTQSIYSLFSMWCKHCLLNNPYLWNNSRIEILLYRSRRLSILKIWIITCETHTINCSASCLCQLIEMCTPRDLLRNKSETCVCVMLQNWLI